MPFSSDLVREWKTLLTMLDLIANSRPMGPTQQQHYSNVRYRIYLLAREQIKMQRILEQASARTRSNHIMSHSARACEMPSVCSFRSIS